MINIAFCDNDQEFMLKIANYTKRFLREQRINARIFTYTDGNQLISSFRKYQPRFDIVFLEINMPSINGKEVAKRLRALDKEFKLVFITACEDETLNTLQYDIKGFIPKALINDKLPIILKRVVTAVYEDNPRIQVFEVDINDNRRAVIRVPINDIIYFECVCRKVYVHTKRESFLLHGYKFSEIVNRYCSLGFVHNHRTCLVNIKYIYAINDLEILLLNETRLPLSRRKKQFILDGIWADVYTSRFEWQDA
ncbi:MAG: response regulator [Syntrophomonadaceae bacterium]|nr:response regulator [Syntrophomonadaceae bacterium]